MHLLSLAAATPLFLAPLAQSSDGFGWSMQRLDLEVHVLPDEKRLEVEGTLEARLEARSSSRGSNLLVNMLLNGDGDPVLRFREVTCHERPVPSFTAIEEEGVHGRAHRTVTWLARRARRPREPVGRTAPAP